MPADFPNNPVVGDTFTGTNGATYTWDGIKWVNTGCGGGALDNLIAGTCISLPKNGNQVTVNASIPCIQTPWLQDENASGFRLMNASFVQTPSLSAPPSNSLDIAGSGNIYFTVNSSAPMSLTPNSVLVNNTVSNPTSDLTLSSNTNVLFSSGGSERMRITSMGNVGIGTSNPQAALSIGNGGQAMFLRPDNSNQFSMGYTANDLTFHWNFNGAPLMVLTGSGNVGIGNVGTMPVNAPGYPWLIVGPQVSSATAGLITVCGNTSNIGQAVGEFSFANYASPSADKRIAVVEGDLDGAVNSGALLFRTYNAGVESERMRVSAAGNVGIGTNTPLGVLDVEAHATSTPQAYMYYAGNVGGVLPSTNLAGGLAIGWNFTGGSAEVDFFNAYSLNPSASGFRFYQMTSPSAANYLGGFNGSGDFFANSVEIVGAFFGPAQTNSCPMLFCGLADGSPGQANETLMFWVDISNNRLVCSFKNSGGSVGRAFVTFTG